MTNEVATTGASVPELYRPPISAGLDASDIRLPKLKIGQFSTNQVQDQLVKAGDIFSHLTAEDATLLREAKPKVGVEDPLEFFVLGIRKGWSMKDENDDLQSYADDDARVPALMENPDPKKRPWRTYSYTVAVPSVDEELPYTLLFTRSSIPAARTINLFVKRYESQGPGYEVPFMLRTKYRENGENRWYVAAVEQAQEPANAKDRKARESTIQVVSDLAMIAAAAPAPSVSRSVAVDDSNEPSI